MLINRDFYLQKLIDKKDNGRIKIITGIRRCGKSFILFKLFKDYLISCGVDESEIIAIALDDIDNIKYRNPFNLDSFIKDKTRNKDKHFYVFIDEIQLSKSVGNPYIENDKKSISFVDVLLGLMKKENIDIYITGSNSKMLSSDILTQFRDRGDEIRISPLSFSEVYQLYNDKTVAFNHYVVYGGMPYVYSLKSDKEKSVYLKNLFSETYIKDILERNNIKNDVEILETLLDFVSSSIGSLTNPNKLAKRFLSEKHINISSNTLSLYLGYFEEAFILSHAKKYDVKGSKYFSTPLKYYFSDLGLRNAILNFRQIEINHIMENILYNDLTRRGYNVDVGVVEHETNINGSRKKRQLEIDFVINKAHQRYYIQSALNVDSPEKQAQETASLTKINDSFKKIIVVKDNIIPYHDKNGILYIGIEEFLLNDSIIESL